MKSKLEDYLNRINARGNYQLSESIRKTAESIGSTHLKNFSFVSHEIGLLFGNVQSGKTGQMFGIICKATDLGFPIFLILTTDNVVLQQQTLDRVKCDLDGYCICGENDSQLFIDNRLQDPTIVVLKKNTRILRLWANIFNTTGFMKGNPLFIVDDEADAASLNTLVNRDSQSTINRHLDIIRSTASSSIYLQVTGTPQALLLQTHQSDWHPMFTYYFRPGRGYLGGDFFFPKSGNPDCVFYFDQLEDPVRDAVIWHLLVSGQHFLTGVNVCNCLVHTSQRVARHISSANEIEDAIAWCKDNLLGEFATELGNKYQELNPGKSEKVSFSELFECVKKILRNNEYKILVMNGKTEVSIDEYSNGCNFVIGGNNLSRGVTFPRLQTIIYTRTAKKPQADTMWQHSRMFGYDRDPGMMRVYIEEKLYKLFSDINSTNNSIISQIEQGIDNIKVFYSDSLSPTRRNVLDKKHVTAISGGTNYFPFDLDNDTIDAISEILKPFEGESYYQVNLRLLKELLSHIVTFSDFRKQSFVSILEAFLAEKPTEQGILIVRRNRDISKGTGALLSPNDWQLGSSFPRKVVLTMYQVTGNKGWNGKKLWIPNIKLPEGIVFYDTDDD